jgi:hypothetical protein
MKAQGLDASEIAKELGCHPMSLYRLLEEVSLWQLATSFRAAYVTRTQASHPDDY